MKTYSVGTICFCDFHFGGKPKGRVTEIVKPGNGKDNAGLVKVKLMETVGAYKKGETLEVSTYYAVPCEQELSPSGFFRRVNTCYQYL